ncbi:hypothetical protein ACFX2G_013701 [Malus domestica]
MEIYEKKLQWYMTALMTFFLQLLKEVNKLKAERQAKIPDWNQPRPGPLTRRILDTPPSKDKTEAWLATLYWKGGPD